MKRYTEKNQAMLPWPSLAQYGATLPLRGGNLFYYDTGKTGTESSGSPALILIHGLGDEADSWRHLIPLLAAGGFRIIAPDLPGFGRSNGRKPGGKMAHNADSPWRGTYGIKAHARALIALMEKTGAVSERNPAVLIGSSMGAMIAQIIAAKRPELARAIALLDGCHPLSGKTDPGFLLMALPFIGAKWYRGFRSNHEAAWRSLYGYYRDLDALGEEDKNFLRSRVIDRVESGCQERAYFSSVRSLISFNIFGQKTFARRMKAYTGKKLVLWGEADRIMPFEKSARFRSLNPDAEVQLIRGAGHLPHQEAPGETAQALINWLAGIARSGERGN